MRVAIIHDHFLYLGGAERFLLALLRLFPQAHLYTTFLNKEYLGVLRNLTSGKIVVSPYDSVLGAHGLADWFKPLVYLYWENLNLDGYDLVISSSHSFSAKSVRVSPPAVHLAYIHTPPRYLWGQFNEMRFLNRQPFKILLSPIFYWLRAKDFAAAQRPDVLIANSKTVQARIKKAYQRESRLIYPPVKIPTNPSPNYHKEYFLVISRLVKQKGIELAIRAANTLRLPLVVVGEGRERQRLEKLAGPTVRFLGFVSDRELAAIYSRAQALIFCGREEDFGLVPVEALARGVPVVAYASGGVKETVVDGQTGVLFRDYSLTALVQALQKLKNLNLPQAALRQAASRFSEKRFLRQFRDLVQLSLKQKSQDQAVTPILGVNVSAITYVEALREIEAWIQQKNRQYVCVAAAHLVIECQKNNYLRQGVNRAGLVTPDGTPLVWLSKLYGRKHVSRVYGPTLMQKLCQLAANQGYKIFLFGRNEPQLARLKKKLSKSHPGLSLVGTRAAARPITKAENEATVQVINNSSADIVFVGLGCPAQELWVIKNRQRLKAPVLVGVGAAFDFLSGDKSQAPLWLQNLGLEWLFRFIQEPRRLWYRYTIINLQFVFLIVKQLLVASRRWRLSL